jgi:hypothetical protein
VGQTLSEGQNLQDAAIVVNYDLPWAIIRLIQRAGRVDRIGQKSERILCYSFLPADGVNRIIRLRERVRQRLRENAEVVGTDEAFFEDDRNPTVLQDLYNEKAGLLDGDADTEIDLSSYAYQIWNDAVAADPSLENTIRQLPNVVYSTKTHTPSGNAPEGVLVYLRTAQGNDMLAWLDRDGRPSGARFKTYERLRDYSTAVRGTLFDSPELLRAIEEIYRFPLCDSARDTLNRQLKAGIAAPDLAQLVLALRHEGRLCQIQDENRSQEPQIICSLGLSSSPRGKP